MSNHRILPYGRYWQIAYSCNFSFPSEHWRTDSWLTESVLLYCWLLLLCLLMEVSNSIPRPLCKPSRYFKLANVTFTRDTHVKPIYKVQLYHERWFHWTASNFPQTWEYQSTHCKWILFTYITIFFLHNGINIKGWYSCGWACKI